MKTLFEDVDRKGYSSLRTGLSKWGSKSNPGIICIVFDTVTDEWCLKIHPEGDQLVYWQEEGQDAEPLDPAPTVVLSRLHQAGLKTQLCYSKDRQHVFCFVGLPHDRMVQWADYRDFDKELDPTEAVKFGRSPGIVYPLAVNTYLEGEPTEYIRKYRKINTPTGSAGGDKDDVSDEQTELKLQRLPLSLWKGVFVQYNASVPQEIYCKYVDGSIFSVTNKLQMLDEIMKTDQDLGGAGLKIIEMARSSHPISAVFAINDEKRLNNLFETETYWKFWGDRWHKVGLSNLRYYYGEKIAFYFAYLQFYTMALMFSASIGSIFFCIQIIQGRVACSGIYIWILYLITWNLALCKYWERRQGFLRNRWGMVRYRDKAVPRPQFNGQKGFSVISGVIEEFVGSKKKKIRKQCISYSTVFFWTSLIWVIIVALFALKEQYRESTSYAIMIGMINAVLIQIQNMIYLRVSSFLNNWENHRLESQYENNMIVKRIVFQIVNSFSSLIFVGFIKPIFWSHHYSSEDQIKINNEVLIELQIQLMSLFLSLIIIQNTQEILLVPLLNNFFRLFKDKTPPAFTDSKSQPAIGEEIKRFVTVDLGEAFHPCDLEELRKDAELQIKKPNPASVRDNMSELIIEQGYATMFVIAFPLAPLFALCNNFVEFRVDTHNLKANQRPIPYAAYGVGLWGKVLWWFAGISVVSNWGLLIFRTNQVQNTPLIDHTQLKLICFFLGLGIIYAFLLVVHFVFQSIPDGLKLHQERTEEIEKFLIIKGLKQQIGQVNECLKSYYSEYQLEEAKDSDIRLNINCTPEK